MEPECGTAWWADQSVLGLLGAPSLGGGLSFTSHCHGYLSLSSFLPFPCPFFFSSPLLPHLRFFILDFSLSLFSLSLRPPAQPSWSPWSGQHIHSGKQVVFPLSVKSGDIRPIRRGDLTAVFVWQHMFGFLLGCDGSWFAYRLSGWLTGL